MGRLALVVGLVLLCSGSDAYQAGQLAQYAALGLATAALAVCWGATGILTLGHAVSFGIGAYATGYFGVNGGERGVLVGLLVGIAVTVCLCVAVGALGLRGRVNAITFALCTLVVLYAGGQVAQLWTSVTGGFNGLIGIPTLSFGSLVATYEQQNFAVIIIASVLVVCLSALMAGPLGGLLVMVRDAPLKTATLGYDVPKVRIAVFAATGAVTAVAGGLFATQVQFVSTDVVGLGLTTNFVIWAMIGSRTSVVGSFLATIVLSHVSDELSQSGISSWLLIQGLLFVAVVLLVPDGLSQALGRLVPRQWRTTSKVWLRREEGALEAPAGLSLVVSGVSCRFGRFVAVNDVGLTFEPGMVHCVIGPNGAGKSTLLNALSGSRLPQRGRWHLGNRELSMKMPWTMARRGMGRKFQAPHIAPTLTVAQNLALSTWGTRRVAMLRLTAMRWRATVPESAWRILRAGDMEASLDAVAGELSHGQRQILELAMTFAASPDVVLLDEPTAGMTAAESAIVADLIKDEAERLGIPVVVVEHDMSLIRAAASRVVVMAAGEVIADGSLDQIEQDERVAALYLGGVHR